MSLPVTVYWQGHPSRKKNNKLRKLETSLTSNSFSAEPGTAVLLTYLKLVKQQMDHTTVVVGVA